MSEKKPLLVTTEHRGVFFGYGVPSDAKTIRLEQARMCVYWPESNRSVIGLAADGPKAGAKIGPPAPELYLRDVTAVAVCSDAAATAMENHEW